MVAQAYCRNAGMVGQHKTADAMCRLDVRRFARQSHLNAGRTPRDELCQLAFTDPLQALVYLIATTSVRHSFNDNRSCVHTSKE